MSHSRLIEFSVRQVEGSRDLDAFLKATRLIFRDDPNWIEPLYLERKEHLDPKKNPYFKSSEVAYWIAEQKGRVIGRISAQVNRVHLERYRDATGHFGFLDAIDNQEVFAALFAAAEGWLRSKGLKRIVGPFSLSINDQSGLLVDGFEDPPVMMMGHAWPYYADRIEACGYLKVKDLIAYNYSKELEVPPVVQKLLTRAERSGRIAFRPLDLTRYDEEFRTILDIFNDAWSDNWGFLPFSSEEVSYLTKAMKPLIDKNLVIIGEADGTAAAMVVILPNFYEAIFDLGGRVFPFGWLKLLWRLKVKGVTTGRMPLMGVRRKFQSTSLGAALAFGVIREARKNAKAKGIVAAELSWVLEDNQAVRHVIETMGAIPYKTYRLYQKDLA